MKRLTRIGIATLALATLGLLAAHRSATAGPRCHKVSATIEDHLVSEGCPSPFGLCTVGTISGDGLLQGDVFNVVDDLVPAATDGNPSLDITQEFTTARGTITFRGSAVYDPVHGAISIISLSPEGDGDFEGATGRLFLNANTGPHQGVGWITGEICLAE